MRAHKEVKDFIDSLKGSYTDQLDSILSKVEEWTNENKSTEAKELLDYGIQRIKERKEEYKEEDFRSLDPNLFIEDQDLEEVEKFYQMLERAMSAIFEGNLSKAQGILQSLGEEISFIQEGIRNLEEGRNLRSFQGLIEEVLYRMKRGQGEKEEIVGPELQIFCSIYGNLLLDTKKYQEAEKFMSLSLMANPISATNLLNMSRLKRQLGKEEEARDFTHRAFREGYRVEDIANAYASEGYFLYKDGRESLALAFNFMALEYQEDNEIAQGNLLLLKNKYPKAKLASKKEFNDYKKSQNIPQQVSEETLSILRQLGEKAEEEENWELAMDIYGNLDQLLDDPLMHEKIHSIMDRYQEDREEFVKDLSQNTLSHNHHHDHTCSHDHHHDHHHGHTCSHDHHHDHHHGHTCSHDHDHSKY